MKVVPLVVNHFTPSLERCPHALVMKGEKPTYDWREHQDEPHHDSIGLHSAMGFAACFRRYDIDWLQAGVS